MSMNALDTALTKLAAASTALEYTAKPGLKDVENAKKEAKAAAEILDSAHKLMSYGVYTVAQEPMAPGVALFDDHGQPAVPATSEETGEPTPLERIKAFPEWNEVEQGDQYQAELDDLALALGEPLAPEWEALWEQDRLLAFKSALFCVAADPKEFLPPGEPAIQIWLAKLQPELPQMPDLLGDFQALHPVMRSKRFDEHLTELGNQDVTIDGEWEDQPWLEAFNEDPIQTYGRLQFALNHRQPVSVTYPTDEEMAAWTAQFAPAAPQFDQAAFFASKLQELEEAGIAEGQKLKAWKKTAKAWQAEFEANPEQAVNKVLWCLQQVSICWDVPSDEQVA